MSLDTRVLPAVNMNDELAKAVTSAVDQADIRAAIIAEAEKQGMAAAESSASQAAAEKAAAEKIAAAKTDSSLNFTRVENIGGREFTFEASSELELERMVNNAFKVAYAVQASDEVVSTIPTVDPAIAQKAEEERAAAKAELDLQFRRGDISAAAYIEQSGAISEYLAKQGIPLESLKATVTRNENTQFEQSWADATEEFKRSPAGADWPGGERNTHQMGLMITALGLTDATDKVAAFAQAYAAMKQKRVIFPGEAEEIATVAARTASSAAPTTTVDPVKTVETVVVPPVVTAKTAATSSALFGASSGTSGAGSSAASTPAAKTDIPADATPAEIIDAWKKGQIAQGIDPNAAFVSTFAGRRA